MSRVRDNDVPVMQYIDPAEVRMIKDMFAYLSGIDKNGKIPAKQALKLYISLGLEVSLDDLPTKLTLRDFLLYADAAAPLDEPAGYAKSMNCLVSQNPDGTVGAVRAENLISFSQNLRRPPPSEKEAELYISSLTEYDECEGEVVVSPEEFQQQLVKSYDAMTLMEEDI